jgi:hypothetical protein
MQPLDDYIIAELHKLEKSRKNETQYKKKRAKAFSIIAEINIINSKLLLYVIPEIALQLKVH